MKKALLLIVIVLFVLFAVLVYQKSSDISPAKQEHTVVTTIYPIYFMTKEIAGEHVNVKRLIKPGSEIHSFSPTPANMVELDKADLLITLGKELEPWTGKLSAATHVEILSLGEGLDLVRNSEQSPEHHAEHKSEEGSGHQQHRAGIDPHVWLDIDNNRKIVGMISRRLSVLYPEYSTQFEENALKMQAKSKTVQKAYEQGLKQCAKHTILVAHDAFGYMERAYGFEAESIMGVFANSRPDAAKIAELTKMIKEKKLRYLFFDPMVSSKSASQLAHDMNLTLEPLYTLGNISLENEKKDENFLMLLYFNLKQLRKGLECR
ncbi:MAG: metal ABC transporter substrate-binding protein [Campylobacterota bacterium]|nr:metal ABC transporter substrate-binding protein [Campylobacterota bacterium]